MAWVTITEDDIRGYLSGQELEAFRRANQSPGESDPLTSQISWVVLKVRNAVLSCPRYSLAADGTIPDGLMDEALALLVIRIMKRAGGAVLDQGGERKKAADEALKVLALVQQGKGPVVTTPTTLEGVGTEMASRPVGVLAVEYSSDDTRAWTLTNLDGI